MNRTREEREAIGWMLATLAAAAVLIVGALALTCAGCGGAVELPAPPRDAAADVDAGAAEDSAAAGDAVGDVDAGDCLICDPAIGWYDRCAAVVVGCPPPSQGNCCGLDGGP